MKPYAYILRSAQICSVIFVVLGGLLSYGVVLRHFGFVLGVIAFMIFPVTIAVAPWYAGFVQNYWWPVLFVYGGAGAACVFGAAFENIKNN